jgi:predicted GNAT family N-acyltransferase
MIAPGTSGAVRIRLGGWEQLGEQASRIRLQVFVREQGVPRQMEIDQFDPVCVHALAVLESGQPVGTGRLLPDGRIGRMAVLPEVRASGVGAALLAHLLDAARRRGDRRIELSAQAQVQGFYRKFGFIAVSDPYDDAGIAHVTMRLELPISP